jgi:hypothetical protein
MVRLSVPTRRTVQALIAAVALGVVAALVPLQPAHAACRNLSGAGLHLNKPSIFIWNGAAGLDPGDAISTTARRRIG